MIGTAINFKSFDGATNFIINNRATQPTLHAESPFYYISVEAIEGLYQADISYESHPIPNAVGEKSGDVFRRGKTITISGKIYGTNLGKLEEGADFLYRMFADKRLRKLTWTRRDTIAVYINCRVNQDLSIVQTVSEGRYSWPWVVGLRADIPFTYKVSDNSLYPTWQE
jgi:hypothetical protein